MKLEKQLHAHVDNYSRRSYYGNSKVELLVYQKVGFKNLNLHALNTWVYKWLLSFN